MENQPPTAARPWFRLASLARMEAAQAQAQAQAQAPAPAPALALAPSQAPAPTAPQAQAQTSSQAPAPAPAPAPRPITQAPIPRIPLARALTMLSQAPQAPQLPQVPPQQQETAPRSSANGAASESQQPPKPQNSMNGAASESQQPPKPQNSVNGAASESQQPPKPQNSTPPPSPKPRIPSRAPTPPASPRVIKPSSPIPPESPKTRQLQPSLTPPPPPPHPEPEPKAAMEPPPKSIFMQREGTNGNVKTVADAESRVEGQTMPSLPRNKTATNGWLATRKKDDGEMQVITMAGENMGAYMELGSPHRHQKHLSGKHPNGHHQHHEGKEGELGSEDVKVADKNKGGKEGKPMAVVVNSNVQSINNSILLSSSCTQHSPGVHITLASHHKPKFSKGSTTDSSFRKGNPHFR